jgi:glycosyltransferase involved in cell wall biosynthesis
MRKRTLLLVIDNLKKGGAEVLLVGILAELNERFRVVLVTLSAECDFSEEQILSSKKYCLGFKNKYSLFSSVRLLKKIIKKEKPSFIHSHLFYSSVIARVACGNEIPLFYSLHSQMSKNVFNNSKIFTILEKKTIKENHYPIAVSKEVLTDYENSIQKVQKSFVLPNYILNNFFAPVKNKIIDVNELKLVCVGNIKKAKNYLYLLKAFKNLKDYPVTLDIYGDGSRKEIQVLQKEIDKNNLAVFLKGQAKNLHKVLPQYDVYVSSSAHEGFGISVIEAMASGLPLLLSNLHVFHEITFNNALFFDISDTSSFINLISEIFAQKYNLTQLSRKGIEISRRYNKEIYLEKLFEIYSSVLRNALTNTPNAATSIII